MTDRLLENDTVLKILSLLVAIAVWVAVNSSAGSTSLVQRRITNVPLDWSVPPHNLTVVSIKPAAVTVTIQGPVSSLGTVQNAWVNLAGISRPGIYSLHTEASVPTGTRLVAVQPNEVVVDVERVVTQRYPVDLEPVGSPPGGYGVVSLGGGHAYSATISGPSGYVSQVARVVGKVTIAGQDASFSDRVILSAVNARGLAVSRVQVTPEVLTVPVAIMAEKTVPVVVHYTGQPTAGFSVKGIAVNPTSVTLAGSAAALAGVSAVDTQAVSIAGASRSVTTPARLVLPSGLQVVGAKTVTVTITVGS